MSDIAAINYELIFDDASLSHPDTVLSFDTCPTWDQCHAEARNWGRVNRFEEMAWTLVMREVLGHGKTKTKQTQRPKSRKPPA